MRSWTVRLPASSTTDDVVRAVEEANAAGDADGILVQMPLPPQVDANRVLDAVSPAKDVDGLTPASLGRLAAGLPGPRPCTPRGVMRLLDLAGEPVAGRRVVILGRSRLVGLPLALLMTHADATVTVCHSRTPDVAQAVRGADIVVAAVGRPRFVQPEWVADHMVLVDVGITRGPEGLVGDVHPAASARVRRWTPVPGGVGPMTVAMLLRNTVEACRGGHDQSAR
jgi:methylenetetrahydrofolate dehydrogenase (NADP+)/methenyltetrahydrofolate cyclohydrolase